MYNLKKGLYFCSAVISCVLFSSLFVSGITFVIMTGLVYWYFYVPIFAISAILFYATIKAAQKYRGDNKIFGRKFISST